MGVSEMDPLKGKVIFPTFSNNNSGASPWFVISCWTDLAKFSILAKLSFIFLTRVLIKIFESHNSFIKIDKK